MILVAFTAGLKCLLHPAETMIIEDKRQKGWPKCLLHPAEAMIIWGKRHIGRHKRPASPRKGYGNSGTD
jgi:hypothetical protein